MFRQLSTTFISRDDTDTSGGLPGLPVTGACRPVIFMKPPWHDLQLSSQPRSSSPEVGLMNCHLSPEPECSRYHDLVCLTSEF